MNTAVFRFKAFFSSWNTILFIYAAAAIIASVLLVLNGTRVIDGHVFTHYNNYNVFKQAHLHLISGQELYAPDLYSHADYENWDYKYSPAFALFMGVFAYLPDAVSVALWNLLNCLVLFFAVKNIEGISKQSKILVLWFIIPELMTSIQNCQSNALIAGLLIAAFNCMQNKRWLSALAIASTVFIKLFGAVGFVLFIFYPQKLRSALYSAGAMLLLTLIPIIVVSGTELVHLYESWLVVLKVDYGNSYGFSVMGWLNAWFGLAPGKSIVVLTGTILLLLPLLKLKAYSSLRFRQLFLFSLLIWMVIFNHKAESPTFIIASVGAALWLFTGRMNAAKIMLGIMVLIFTQLSASDIFPASMRAGFIIPYVIKPLPCILVWVKIMHELIMYKHVPEEVNVKQPSSLDHKINHHQL